jgi:hypothetical protein
VYDDVEARRIGIESLEDGVGSLLGSDVRAKWPDVEVGVASLVVERDKRLIAASRAIDDVSLAGEIEREGMAEPAGCTSDQRCRHDE